LKALGIGFELVAFGFRLALDFFRFRLGVLNDVFGLALDLLRFGLRFLNDVLGLLAGVFDLLLRVRTGLVEGLLQGLLDLAVVVDLVLELLHLFLQAAAIAL
jgi:hypothetical protein